VQEACIQGTSTRSVDELVRAMGMSGISKSQVAKRCQEIDERVVAFLERPLEVDWPYIWLDATSVKVRREGRVVSVAVVLAIGVNVEGRREVLGMDIGLSQAETLRTGGPRLRVLDRVPAQTAPAGTAGRKAGSPARVSKPPSPRSWARSGSAVACTSSAT
jgi:hypothetical protein